MGLLCLDSTIETTISFQLFPTTIYCKISFMLWKESFNSDGQQFCQYHQSKRTTTTTHWTQINTKYFVANPCYGTGSHMWRGYGAWHSYSTRHACTSRTYDKLCISLVPYKQWTPFRSGSTPTALTRYVRYLSPDVTSW